VPEERAPNNRDCRLSDRGLQIAVCRIAVSRLFDNVFSEASRFARGQGVAACAVIEGRRGLSRIAAGNKSFAERNGSIRT